MSAEEWNTRVNLAACYRLVDLYGMSDMTRTHISAKIQGEESFLLNPFGLMDAILSLLGWDWYRDKPQRGTNKGPNQGRNSRPGKNPRWTKTSSSINRRFGKNGNRLFDQYRRMGMSESEALKRVTRAARKLSLIHI